MLKKMRWRFIGSAMLAFGAVILIIGLGVNIWNNKMMTSQLDFTIEKVLKNDDRVPPNINNDFNEFPMFFGNISDEYKYTLRFFIVHCDSNGNILDSNKEYIKSLNNEQINDFCKYVLSKKDNLGYYQGYRYKKNIIEGETIIAFLNAERELQSIKMVLAITYIVSFFSLILVFVLLFIFSKRAINPYIKNIEAQKQFITNASHELKTPLTSISMSADILAMTYEKDEWIQNIQKQSSRMSKLIVNLISLSKMDEENSYIERAEFSLSDTIWEVSEPISAIARAMGKEYITDIENDIIYNGNQTLIQQMISCLLDNAVKYSDENGKIRLVVKKKHKKIEIMVYNTFSLVKEIKLDKLFERFYRTDPARNSENSFGVGLSFAKSIAEKHNASIHVKAIGDDEICFYIIL